MREIFAKFNGICAKTGKKIKKGERCLYDPAAKKVYSLDSGVDKNQDDPAKNMIQEQEDAYFDNFCYNNNI